MSNVEIDKKVPIPPPGAGNHKSKYPWSEMEVGDSFVMTVRSDVSARSMASVRARKDGRKYAVRKQDDGTFRVWRIA